MKNIHNGWTFGDIKVDDFRPVFLHYSGLSLVCKSFKIMGDKMQCEKCEKMMKLEKIKNFQGMKKYLWVCECGHSKITEDKH